MQTEEIIIYHKKYCNEYFRTVYGVPSHLVIPPIEKKFIVRPYEEKENIFAYSFDSNPFKQQILDLVQEKNPGYRKAEIAGLLNSISE